MNKAELRQKVSDMTEQTEYLRSQILMQGEECDQVQEEFDEIQQVVKGLVNDFKKAKFSTKVSQHMQYDD